MSEYNAKNYTEQGGDVTHIGGKIVYDNGLMPNMSTADVTSDTVAKVRNTLNALTLVREDRVGQTSGLPVVPPGALPGI